MQQIALKNLKTTWKRCAKSGRALEVDDDDEDNQGNKDEKGWMRKRRMLRFSLGLLRTAYLPVMTTARTASLVMDSYLKALYHMYDSDSFLGLL